MDQHLYQQAHDAARQLIATAKLEAGALLVVGCSSSEIAGDRIGTASNTEIAAAVFSGIFDAVKEKGIFLAAQCCEHLNRAIIIESAYAKLHNLPQVNVVPQPKAGGSFATAAYERFEDPCAVEFIKADAGMDIGDTLIGMHLKHVAVPVRLDIQKIGNANLVCARTRPKCIGGARAHYDETKM